MRRTILQSVGAAGLIAGTLVASLSTTAMGASKTPWSWHVAGVLSRHPVCSSSSAPGSLEICSYRIANAPRPNGVETGVVTVKNTSKYRKCYGISLSTAYMGGLQDFCVKSGSTGHYRTSGPARHYKATQLSLFVTSGSTTKPIQPRNDLGHSPFTITFSEPG